jgi:hypothetical protein
MKKVRLSTLLAKPYCSRVRVRSDSAARHEICFTVLLASLLLIGLVFCVCTMSPKTNRSRHQMDYWKEEMDRFDGDEADRC